MNEKQSDTLKKTTNVLKRSKKKMSQRKLNTLDFHNNMILKNQQEKHEKEKEKEHKTFDHDNNE